MSKLKARKPQTVEPRKPKIVIFGKSGIGKTHFGMQFKNPLVIDCEGGATRSVYQDLLAKSGGGYIGVEDGANDFETVIQQVKLLATEDHPYDSLVIDSLTKLFATCASLEAERLGDKNAFGADKKPAMQGLRRLVMALNRLDMSAVIVCHEKSAWGDVGGQRAEIGKEPDVHPSFIYDMDLCLEIKKRGSLREAVVTKTRISEFPDGERFPLTMEEFAKRYGKESLISPVKKIILASKKQVEEMNRMIGLLKITPEEIEKWLTKANADKLDELSEDQAGKVIASLTEKLNTK